MGATDCNGGFFCVFVTNDGNHFAYFVPLQTVPGDCYRHLDDSAGYQSSVAVRFYVETDRHPGQFGAGEFSGGGGACCIMKVSHKAV